MDGGWIDGFIIVRQVGAKGSQNTICIMKGTENYGAYLDNTTKTITRLKIDASDTSMYINNNESQLTNLVIVKAILRYF